MKEPCVLEDWGRGEMEKARKVFGHFASLIYFEGWLVVLAFTFLGLLFRKRWRRLLPWW